MTTADVTVSCKITHTGDFYILMCQVVHYYVGDKYTSNAFRDKDMH